MPSNADYEVVEPTKFFTCLNEWIDNGTGKNFKDDIKFEDTTKTVIKGWKQSIVPIEIENIATDGPQYLDDLRRIMDTGFDDTYAYSGQILDFEQYVVLIRELVLTIGLAGIAVFLVVTFITFSLPVTALVMLAIILVDVFLLSLIYYWDLTLNNIIIIQLVIGLGLAVDYSAHIAHTYLITPVPK